MEPTPRKGLWYTGIVVTLTLLFGPQAIEPILKVIGILTAPHVPAL